MISLLNIHGLCVSDIAWLVTKGHLILRSIASIESSLKRSKELGFRPGSAMFLHGLATLSRVRNDVLAAKMELFRSFGWSKEEFLTAFRKFPCFAHLSERTKMEFLVNVSGCDKFYFVSRPMNLGYSLERRLRPRYRVVETLKAKELVERDADFYTAVSVSESKFVPGLYESYVTYCQERVQTVVSELC